MNNQEAYNTAKAGIIEQGCFSTVQESYGATCKYRSPDGSKCAVGHLIPDDEYLREMEDWSVDSIVVRLPLNADCDLLYDLQDAHDRASTIKPDGADYIDWAARMIAVANRWDLKP